MGGGGGGGGAAEPFAFGVIGPGGADDGAFTVGEGVADDFGGWAVVFGGLDEGEFAAGGGGAPDGDAGECVAGLAVFADGEGLDEVDFAGGEVEDRDAAVLEGDAEVGVVGAEFEEGEGVAEVGFGGARDDARDGGLFGGVDGEEDGIGVDVGGGRRQRDFGGDEEDAAIFGDADAAAVVEEHAGERFSRRHCAADADDRASVIEHFDAVQHGESVLVRVLGGSGSQGGDVEQIFAVGGPVGVERAFAEVAGGGAIGGDDGDVRFYAVVAFGPGDGDGFAGGGDAEGVDEVDVAVEERGRGVGGVVVEGEELGDLVGGGEVGEGFPVVAERGTEGVGFVVAEVEDGPFVVVAALGNGFGEVVGGVGDGLEEGGADFGEFFGVGGEGFGFLGEGGGDLFPGGEGFVVGDDKVVAIGEPGGGCGLEGVVLRGEEGAKRAVEGGEVEAVIGEHGGLGSVGGPDHALGDAAGESESGGEGEEGGDAVHVILQRGLKWSGG